MKTHLSQYTFFFLRERITHSDRNLQVTDLDISIVWHRQIAPPEDRIRKRPRLICLSIGGRFVFFFRLPRTFLTKPRSIRVEISHLSDLPLPPRRRFLLPSPEKELNRKNLHEDKKRKEAKNWERRVADRSIRLSTDISLHSYFLPPSTSKPQ